MTTLVSIKLCVRKWKILIKFSSVFGCVCFVFFLFRSLKFGRCVQTNMNLNMHFFPSRFRFCKFSYVCDSYNFSRKLNQFKLCVCLCISRSLAHTHFAVDKTVFVFVFHQFTQTQINHISAVAASLFRKTHCEITAGFMLFSLFLVLLPASRFINIEIVC